MNKIKNIISGKSRRMIGEAVEPMEGITMFYGMPKTTVPEQIMALKESKKKPKK